jgi:hypothetical protein
MLNSFVKGLGLVAMTTLACATSAVITSAPAAAQFRAGYALDDDDSLDYRPARRRVEVDDEYGAPLLEPRAIERRIVRPVIERRVIEREVVQPVVERTIVHRVVQPVVEHRIVHRRPIVRRVVVDHKPIARRAHFLQRPWHERRRCFLPERHLCG